MSELTKIGLGGGCHWCTEAVFQALKGVSVVKQGYISSKEEYDCFSEAVLVTFNAEVISLASVLSIHLQTHKSLSNHSFRKKYRSAIYYFSEEQKLKSEQFLQEAQSQLPLEDPQHFERYVTQVLPFNEFKPSRETLQDYFRKNPNAPFCQRYIHPKLSKIPSELKKNNFEIPIK